MYFWVVEGGEAPSPHIFAPHYFHSKLNLLCITIVIFGFVLPTLAKCTLSAGVKTRY